jgi:hypothetical protein
MEVVIPQNPEVWKGYFQHLDIAIEAARTYGNTVEVLEPFPCAAVDEFRKHYRHNSPNAVWFQQWTFEQWLLLAEWMKTSNREVVFKIDSDALVFTNLQQLWESVGKPSPTRWIPEIFVTAKVAMDFSDYIIETFKKGLEIERQALGGGTHAADQSILGGLVTSLNAPNLSCIRSREMLDDSIFSTHSEQVYEGHKDIWFVQGQPCWIRSGGYTRLLTMHCWAAAKKKMDAIWHQSRLSIGGPPVRMHLC